MRRRRLVAAAGVLGFSILQLFQPTIESRTLRSEMPMPGAVRAVLRTSCFDCHSNETELKWFDRIAPGSWLVARDVKRGRARLNFSELGTRPAPEQRAKLFEAIEMIAGDVMPPGPYRALHRGAAVNDHDLGVLKDFAASLVEPPARERKVDTTSLAALTKRTVAPAPNGVAFPTDVATWTPVQVSERWDNGTMRMIVGNEAALAAVKGRLVNPWPDGAALAKIAWRPGKDGPSSFVHIEMMKKSGTDWTFARWVGNELTPYGHDASFSAECAGCHEPMRGNDFVYSLPTAGWPGGTIDAISVDTGQFVITSAARTLTWPARDDPHWFGARIASP